MVNDKQVSTREAERTSCFLTGRNSSFVAASSIDGLLTCHEHLTKQWEKMKSAHHSSEEEESVKVGVGRRFRLFVLPSSTDATASLSALRFKPFE